MKKWLKIGLIIFGVFAIIYLTYSLQNPEKLILNQPSFETLCREFGGTFLQEYNECEGISKESCKSITVQATYNECASACRNNPEAESCTMQCVQVCKF